MLPAGVEIIIPSAIKFLIINLFLFIIFNEDVCLLCLSKETSLIAIALNKELFLVDQIDILLIKLSPENVTGELEFTDNFFTKIDEIEEIFAYLSKILKNYSFKKINILYGGSVNLTNISNILNLQNVNGVLVGSASTKSDFIKYFK